MTCTHCRGRMFLEWEMDGSHQQRIYKCLACGRSERPAFVPLDLPRDAVKRVRTGTGSKWA